MSMSSVSAAEFLLGLGAHDVDGHHGLRILQMRANLPRPNLPLVWRRHRAGEHPTEHMPDAVAGMPLPLSLTAMRKKDFLCRAYHRWRRS